MGPGEGVWVIVLPLFASKRPRDCEDGPALANHDDDRIRRGKGLVRVDLGHGDRIEYRRLTRLSRGEEWELPKAFVGGENAVRGPRFRITAVDQCDANVFEYKIRAIYA